VVHLAMAWGRADLAHLTGLGDLVGLLVPVALAAASGDLAGRVGRVALLAPATPTVPN
jgi:hypothetical protein